MTLRQNDSEGMFAARGELANLMKNSIAVSASDIAYFNVSETAIGGWPAVVGVMKYSRHYTSGRFEPPGV